MERDGRFVINKRPILEEENDEDIPATPKIIHMSQSQYSKKAKSMSEPSRARLNNFLGQFGESKHEETSPSEGRFDGNKVVVDNIKQRFTDADPVHISSLKPPGTSTPSNAELIDAWNFIDARDKAQSQLLRDPLVRFVRNVDGFIEENLKAIGSESRRDSITVQNLYSIIASMGGSSGPMAPVFPMQTITLQSRGGSFRNVGAGQSPITIERGMFETPPNNGILSNIDSMRRQTASRIMTDTIQRNKTRSIGNIGGTVLFPDSTPSSSRYEFSQAGEGQDPTTLTTLPQATLNIGSNDPVAPQKQTGQPVRNDPMANASAPPQDPDLLRYADDPRFRPAVDKYLSNMRVAQAYDFMNRPEITGEIILNNTTMGCIELAYFQLVNEYPDNFGFMDSIQLFTSNLGILIARYCSLWIGEIRASSTNRQTLNMHWARLIENRNSLEKKISCYSWESHSQRFVQQDISRRGSYNMSVRQKLEDRLAVNNSMFYYP